MALVNCRECGKQVSTEATACPHCGAPVANRAPSPAPPKKSTSPWTVIGWLILIVIAMMFWGCVKREMARQDAVASGASPSAASAAADGIQPGELKARVISVKCEERSGRTRATVIVENTGSKEISFAQMFLTYVGSTSESSYGNPSSIPPGASSSFMFVRSAGANTGCQIDRLQDGQGHQVDLAPAQ